MDFENKIKMYEEILNINNDNNINNFDICEYCEIELIITNDNTYTCPYCGISKYYLYDVNLKNFNIYYKRLTHFNNTIRILKGELYPKLSNELINNIKKTKLENINKLLKKYKLINYKPYILYQYYKIKPIQLNTIIINQLITKLNNFEKKFNKFKSERKNFINYNLLIKIFLKELGYNNLSEQIEIFKSNETIKKHTELYNKIINL